MDSNNINMNGLPSEEELQRLANFHFKSPPVEGFGVSPQQFSNPSLLQSHLQNQGNTVDVNDSAFPHPTLSKGEGFRDYEGGLLNLDTGRTSLSGSGVSPSAMEQFKAPVNMDYKTSLDPLHNSSNPLLGRGLDEDKTPNYERGLLPLSDLGYDHLPASVAGSGISPSVAEKGNFINIYEPQTNLPDPHFEEGKIPASVAGSGISPSVAEKETLFNIYEPQTSLPDPHFEEGKIPASVAGSGISPSVAKNENKLPLESDNSFEAELKAALNEIISYIPSTQLPEGGNSTVNESSFYFLNGANYFNRSNEFHSPFENKQTGISKSPGFVKPPFDINLIKQDFPILQQKVNGKQIVWLDNAATTQKPKPVIDRLGYFYENENSNVHRAAHELAARATDAYETARKKVQRFINASSVNEIVFVRGTTEGINLVSQSWGDQFLKPGDEIVLTHLEHHANIVPWQLLAKKKDLVIKVVPVDDDGQVILSEYGKLLSSKTKLVSFAQVSNALGTITPAIQMVQMAHAIGAKVLVDGAQSVSHMRTDVQLLDADWFVFSGHKIFGPTGIGVVYGKEELLNEMQPWQGGGNMIKDVTFEKTEFNTAPTRFEAGTGNIADAVGLGAALDYINKIGIDLISAYEHALLLYATALLKTVPGLRLIGTAHEKASVMSFVLHGFSNDEVGQVLNKEGIAVRTGHHCAQPILRRFGVESTVRPSLAFYNTCSDVDRMIDTLLRLVKG